MGMGNLDPAGTGMGRRNPKGNSSSPSLLERPGQPLGVGCFFDDLLPDGRKLLGGDDCCGVFAALDLALIGTLEGADGDDPVRSRHLQLQIGVVGDNRELRVAWMP